MPVIRSCYTNLFLSQFFPSLGLKLRFVGPAASSGREGTYQTCQKSAKTHGFVLHSSQPLSLKFRVFTYFCTFTKHSPGPEPNPSIAETSLRPLTARGIIANFPRSSTGNRSRHPGGSSDWPEEPHVCPPQKPERSYFVLHNSMPHPNAWLGSLAFASPFGVSHKTLDPGAIEPFCIALAKFTVIRCPVMADLCAQ